jgi:hypothetical protein
MQGPSNDIPQAFDAAIAANEHARREKLVRAVRNQTIRTRVAFALSGCVAVFALAAFFVAGDIEATAIIAMIACVSFGFAFIAGRANQKKAVDALREVDQSS